MNIISINKEEVNKIKNGNLILFKKKIDEEVIKWGNKLLMTKEDHRYYQGIYITLLDIQQTLNGL